MPLVRENWKVRACSVVASGSANAMPGSAARANVVSASAAKRNLEPVKPAAAALVAGGRAFGLRRGFGGTAQDAIGEAGIGALHVRLVGLKLGADGGIGVLHAG